MLAKRLVVTLILGLTTATMSMTSFAICAELSKDEYRVCNKNRIAAIESIDAIKNATEQLTSSSVKPAKKASLSGKELILA